MWALATENASPGADAWILPEPEEAQFSRQIDLQLGFPYANWYARDRKLRTETLLAWTDPSFEFECPPSSALICPSASRLDCKWVIFLPIRSYKHQPMGWYKECQKVFSQLNLVNPRLWITPSWKEELLKARLFPVGSYCEYQ